MIDSFAEWTPTDWFWFTVCVAVLVALGLHYAFPGYRARLWIAARLVLPWSKDAMQWKEELTFIVKKEKGKRQINRAQMGEAFNVFLKWTYFNLRKRPRTFLRFLERHGK